jgi:hypothetical protein
MKSFPLSVDGADQLHAQTLNGVTAATDALTGSIWHIAF